MTPDEIENMTPDEIETLRLRLGLKLIRLIDRLRLKMKMRPVLKKYVEAFRQRDADTRYYIRILNHDPPKGTEGERECIERIVNAWVNNEHLPQDDMELLNEIGDIIRREIQPDFSVHTVQRAKPVLKNRYALFAYVELYEAIVEWDGGKKERARPRRCGECGKWFASAPRGRIGLYCSRECDLAASNRRNAETIKSTVREGRKKGDYI